MQEFIARENIRRFEAQLRQTHDEAQRRTLRQLIAEQERTLEAALEKAPGKARKNGSATPAT